MTTFVRATRSMHNTANGWRVRRVVVVGLALAAGATLALLPQNQLLLIGAGLAALAVIGLIFHEPVIGLALTLAVGPFQPLERVTLQLPIDSGQVLLGLTLLAYVFRALATRQLPITRFKSPVTVALAVFIAICLLTFFPARDFADWANECIKWLQMLVIVLLVMNERSPRKRAILIGAVLVVGAGQAIYGIVQAYLRGFGPKEFLVVGSKTLFRAYGTFEQPNPFGGYLGLVWPLAAGVLIAHVRLTIDHFRRPKSSVVNWQSSILLILLSAAVIAVCLVAINASGSRGALVGVVAAVAVMALALLPKPWVWLGALLVMALVLMGLKVISVPASLETQLQQILELDVRNAHILPATFSTIERLAHWQAAVRMMEAYPWFGVGFGNYGAAYPQFQLLIWDNALGHAHNYYLNVFAETGVVGFLAYLALWATVFVVGWRLRRPSASVSTFSILNSSFAIGLLGAFAHLAAHHLFDNLYVANMHLLLGVYLGLLAAMWLERNAHSALTALPLSSAHDHDARHTLSAER